MRRDFFVTELEKKTKPQGFVYDFRTDWCRRHRNKVLTVQAVLFVQSILYYIPIHIYADRRYILYYIGTQAQVVHGEHDPFVVLIKLKHFNILSAYTRFSIKFKE